MTTASNRCFNSACTVSVPSHQFRAMVCNDLNDRFRGMAVAVGLSPFGADLFEGHTRLLLNSVGGRACHPVPPRLHRFHPLGLVPQGDAGDRKSTRLNSSHGYISYAVF